MFSQKVITTEGAILRFSLSKKFTFLKNDPNNNFLWKSFKTNTLSNKIKNILLYKKRFLR
jgi:hypothetical protein